MLIFEGKSVRWSQTPSPLAYAVYAFINVDNCERPLKNVDDEFLNMLMTSRQHIYSKANSTRIVVIIIGIPPPKKGNLRLYQIHYKTVHYWIGALSAGAVHIWLSLYYKRRRLYLCSAKDPVLHGSGSRRGYRRKGTSLERVYVCL